MQLFPMITTAAARPPRLDEVTFHIASDTGQFSVGYVLAGVTLWISIGTSVGLATAVTSYLGGTQVTATQKGISFTASPVEATVYEITATGLVATLSSLDAVGTRYEFYDKTGNANPNFTATPNGGKVIDYPPGNIGGASANITAQGFWRSVLKMSDGNWRMGGI